ncbi:MAG: hypothetical protein C0605_14270, partial [Hyphomicrobiales bacterium]
MCARSAAGTAEPVGSHPAPWLTLPAPAPKRRSCPILTAHLPSPCCAPCPPAPGCSALILAARPSALPSPT